MASDPKREAELAIARLETRKEMRSADLDEDSAVITERAKTKVHSSTPPAAKGIVAILAMVPGWQRGFLLLALLAALVFGGGKWAGLF